jgi:hypothetical protein
MKSVDGTDPAIWANLTASYRVFFDALNDFLREGVDRVSLIREALAGPERWIALEMIRYLSPAQLRELFEDLVEGASTGHGYVHLYREFILSLPRDWVLERIETAAEPYLKSGTEDEYRRLLELYSDLDSHLLLKLAKRAASSEDPEVRCAGLDFLDPGHEGQ